MIAGSSSAAAAAHPAQVSWSVRLKRASSCRDARRATTTGESLPSEAVEWQCSSTLMTPSLPERTELCSVRMVAEQKRPALVALRQRRHEVIDRMTEDFARDLLDVDDFEQRVDLAHRATSLESLDELVADLESLEQGAPPID